MIKVENYFYNKNVSRETFHKKYIRHNNSNHNNWNHSEKIIEIILEVIVEIILAIIISIYVTVEIYFFRK